jgi:hypothetical protein
LKEINIMVALQQSHRTDISARRISRLEQRAKPVLNDMGAQDRFDTMIELQKCGQNGIVAYRKALIILIVKGAL